MKIKEQRDFEESESLAQQMWTHVEGLRGKVHADDEEARTSGTQDMIELRRLSADLLKKAAPNRRSSRVNDVRLLDC